MATDGTAAIRKGIIDAVKAWKIGTASMYFSPKSIRIKGLAISIQMITPIIIPPVARVALTRYLRSSSFFPKEARRGAKTAEKLDARTTTKLVSLEGIE